LKTFVKMWAKTVLHLNVTRSKRMEKRTIGPATGKSQAGPCVWGQQKGSWEGPERQKNTSPRPEKEGNHLFKGVQMGESLFHKGRGGRSHRQLGVPQAKPKSAPFVSTGRRGGERSLSWPPKQGKGPSSSCSKTGPPNQRVRKWAGMFSRDKGGFCQQKP